MVSILNGGVSRRTAALAAGAIAIAALLWLASGARAAELLYWNNYEEDTVSVANIDGSGGGPLNLAGAKLEDPEGMAYDPVTNRLFLGSSSAVNGEIVFINLDGSGAGVFNAPGAVFEEPEGIAIDPIGRMIYWVNSEGGGAAEGSIGWAKLDGSAGGLLNTSGATLDDPYRGISFDPASGRLFWANDDPEPAVISFANANNTGGGGDLSLTGATPPKEITGLSINPASGQIFWLENSLEKVSFASLSGGNGGDTNLTGAVFDDPYGLALDPSLGRLYWGNYGVAAEKIGAIGFAAVTGGGAGINIATAPVGGPQDPVIIKSPVGTGAPVLARSAKSRSSLTCPPGSWGADFPGSFVYQGPRTFAYQWTRDGAPIAGATAATLEATRPGSYACIVTAANQAGAASQVSAPLKVKAAKVKLTTKRKARVQPGGVATFKVKAVNQGDLKSKKARVCVKAPKKAKADLKAKPRCKSLGKVKGKGKDSAKLRIKVGDEASGVYKVTFQVKGSPGKAAKAKIVVTESKR